MKSELGNLSDRAWRSQRRRGHSASGLTLVEVLLAVTLGGMMVAAAAVVSVHAIRAKRMSESLIQARWERSSLLHRFRQDVASRLRGLPDGVSAVRVSADPEKLIEITALAPVSSGAPSFSRRLPARITYLRRSVSDRSNLMRLVRRVEPLVVGVEAAVDEVLADEIEAVVVEEFVDKTWRTAEASPNSGRTPPTLAVRLRCRRTSSHGPAEVCTVSLADEAADKASGAGT